MFGSLVLVAVAEEVEVEEVVVEGGQQDYRGLYRDVVVVIVVVVLVVVG